MEDSIARPQYRTAFHFQPPKNWMNDPNGPMYYNGTYHLFYQWNPDSPLWVPAITWGHAISPDLVNWTNLPPAITHDKPFDALGCWSGSITFLPDGNCPVLLYTGRDELNREVQNVAFPAVPSDPILTKWIKPDYNPVIDLPPGTDPSSFRDPTTAWLGLDGLWRVVVATVADKTGKALLYKSRDFVKWEQALQPLWSVERSGMLECPDFFAVRSDGSEEGVEKLVGDGDWKHVLTVALFDRFTDHYLLGRYDELKDVFVPDEEEPPEGGVGLRWDYGVFYACKGFYDGGKRRRVLWGWVKEMDTKEDALAKGWAGIQTIPRAVWLEKSGRQLIQWPVDELKSLRRQEFQMVDAKIKPGSPVKIEGLNASQVDIEVEFDLQDLSNAETLDPIWLNDPQKLCNQKGPFVTGGIGPFGLLVLASGGLEECTAIFFRIFKVGGRYVTLMCSDQTRSSLREGVSKPSYGAFVDIDIEKTRKISLRTLVDHSVVESFGAHGRTCITARIYPVALASGDVHLFVFNNGSEFLNVNLNAWEMANAEIK